ncbi:MAG: magnesium transporter [Hyphomonas sp.]
MDSANFSASQLEDASVQSELLKDLIEAIDERDGRWIARALNRQHPADAADLLEMLSYDSFEKVVGLLGGHLSSEILIELRDEYREGAVETMPDDAVASVLDELDSDDATAILEDIEDNRRERILEELEPGDRAQYEQVLAFEEETAGRLMQREFVAAPEYWTVGHAIDHARERAEELPEIFYEIYVTDPAFRPLGVVTLSMLLRSSRETKLSELMLPLMSDIATGMDQEEVAYQFQKYSLASAPVKDGAGRLVGMITVDDMVDVIQNENTEDILALSNVSSADGSHSVLDTIKARAPWLGINLFTAFIVSGVIAVFDNVIVALVPLAILMPMISALGGNAGSQTLAVAVRAIAEREMEGPAVRRAIFRELLTGIGNGTIFAVAVALMVFVWFRDPGLSIVAGSALIATFTWACLLGILLPLGLKRLGADPAVASSVFVLTLTDIVAFFSFLGLAALFLL